MESKGACTHDILDSLRCIPRYLRVTSQVPENDEKNLMLVHSHVQFSAIVPDKIHMSCITVVLMHSLRL